MDGSSLAQVIPCPYSNNVVQLPFKCSYEHAKPSSIWRSLQSLFSLYFAVVICLATSVVWWIQEKSTAFILYIIFFCLFEQQEWQPLKPLHVGTKIFSNIFKDENYLRYKHVLNHDIKYVTYIYIYVCIIENQSIK